MQREVLGAFNELSQASPLPPLEGARTAQPFVLGEFISPSVEFPEWRGEGVRGQVALRSGTTLGPTMVGTGLQSIYVPRPSVVDVLTRVTGLEVTGFDEIKGADVASVLIDVALSPLHDFEVSATADIAIPQVFGRASAIWSRPEREFGILGAARGGGRLPYTSLIRTLVERDQVSAARNVLNALPDEAFEEPQLLALKRVLAVPKVSKKGVADFDRSGEYQWLREHGREYVGKWVAVEGDRLVAVAESLKELRGQLRDLNLAKPPLIHRIS